MMTEKMRVSASSVISRWPTRARCRRDGVRRGAAASPVISVIGESVVHGHSSSRICRALGRVGGAAADRALRGVATGAGAASGTGWRSSCTARAASSAISCPRDRSTCGRRSGPSARGAPGSMFGAAVAAILATVTVRLRPDTTSGIARPRMSGFSRTSGARVGRACCSPSPRCRPRQRSSMSGRREIRRRTRFGRSRVRRSARRSPSSWSKPCVPRAPGITSWVRVPSLKLRRTRQPDLRT